MACDYRADGDTYRAVCSVMIKVSKGVGLDDVTMASYTTVFGVTTKKQRTQMLFDVVMNIVKFVLH